MIVWVSVVVLTLAAQAPAAPARAAQEPGVTSGPLAAVERLQEAFNAHDVDAMARSVTEDVGWYFIDGAAIAVEADGRAALVEGMRAYFEQIPTARSEIEGAFVSGRYVTVRERAYWKQGDAERSQAALAVYEVRDGLVARVWYYPAEP